MRSAHRMWPSLRRGGGLSRKSEKVTAVTVGRALFADSGHVPFDGILPGDRTL
nr:hypothetical protein [Kibdelosporangium sp. MJ126-NF4]CTQ94461.1 hypothetical protein [Kibdelosporangium sp. MJ126-NF4]